MINRYINYIIRGNSFLQIEEEVRLYAILKIKKELEIRFLNGDFKIKVNELRFKIKYILYTKNFSIIFDHNIFSLVEKLKNVLKRDRYKKFLSKGKNITIKKVDDIYANTKPRFFSIFENYNKKLEEVNSFLIVQGSYADNTFVSYSDLDLVIIGPLSKEVSLIKKQIDTELVKIDPLQHHGVFYINSSSFSNYWQMDLPLSTLEKAIVFSDSEKKINISHHFHENMSSFMWLSAFLKNNEHLSITIETGVFYAKYLLSQLMLVPTLILAYRGSYVYKKDSFTIAKELYTDKAWKCIDLATFFRKRWNQNTIDNNYSSGRDIKNTKINKEHNVMSEVLEIDEDKLIEFNNSFKFFIEETQILINN